jgi:hypothetical protein
MKYSVTCERGGTSVSYGKRPKPEHTVFVRKTLDENLKRPVSWQLSAEGSIGSDAPSVRGGVPTCGRRMSAIDARTRGVSM